MTTKPTRKRQRLMSNDEAEQFVRQEVEHAIFESGYVYARGVGIVAPKKVCKLVSMISNAWWLSLTGKERLSK